MIPSFESQLEDTEEDHPKRKRTDGDGPEFQSLKRRKTAGSTLNRHIPGSLESKYDELKAFNLELTKERDELRLELQTVKEQKNIALAKYDDDRRRYLDNLKYLGEKESELRTELKKLKSVQVHKSEKSGKDVEDVNERLKDKMKEMEVIKVDKVREVNSALAEVEKLKLQLECQTNEIKLLKGQLSQNITEDGLPVVNEEGKGVKSEVEDVKALMQDLKETYMQGDSGRIDPASTEGTARICALQRENRELKAKLSEETEEKETKWSLMEMANSERVKTAEMEQKVARLIELEEKVRPLEEENKRWRKFLEECLTGCENITQAEVKLNEILQESLENLKTCKNVEVRLKALNSQHSKLKQQLKQKSADADKYLQKMEILQSQLTSTKRDLDYFQHMHAFHHKILNDIEQVKSPDPESIQARRLKGLTKEVEVLTKRLKERTSEKDKAEQALLKAAK